MQGGEHQEEKVKSRCSDYCEGHGGRDQTKSELQGVRGLDR